MSDRLVGVCMMRDEIDIAEFTLRHMSEQCDELIVADNNSTDGTRELLDSLAGELPLTVLDDPDPGYFQARKTTALAELAYAKHGAVYVAAFDADEWWSHASGHALRDVLVAADGHIVNATLTNWYASSMDDAGEANPYRRVSWRWPTPQPLPKVIVRWAPGCVIAAGNHSVQHVGGWASGLAGVTVRHVPYRSAEQFARKAINGSQAYSATNLPLETGAHWRSYGQHYERGGVEALHEIFREFFYYELPTAAGLLYDPLP